MDSEENEKLEVLYEMLDDRLEIVIVLLIIIAIGLFVLIYLFNSVVPIFRFGRIGVFS